VTSDNSPACLAVAYDQLKLRSNQTVTFEQQDQSSSIKQFKDGVQ